MLFYHTRAFKGLLLSPIYRLHTRSVIMSYQNFPMVFMLTSQISLLCSSFFLSWPRPSLNFRYTVTSFTLYTLRLTGKLKKAKKSLPDFWPPNSCRSSKGALLRPRQAELCTHPGYGELTPLGLLCSWPPSLSTLCFFAHGAPEWHPVSMSPRAAPRLFSGTNAGFWF